ncbi:MULTISPECIES: outer membrane beta-barrel protein [unclassified Pseudomonas]|uniref:outer membrane beta-barrel protein n=1 Tax=unclassified Pseudomonas TaxID=196821 RepID=UPI002AC8CBDB|nr:MULTISPECIES: outer membrane beta-barrel protein [unclassified Pseudomonas]MEB0039875.1 outer membrane beta-barrel protein [Pseudomonas sp. MH10]MEB0120641.1 outer membrane beta-barrel protein [Pseudomonas sp. CCI1.2]WPX64612.1 outer membrane beta-barrel protein [Pseudomonas sp. MH10]
MNDRQRLLTLLVLVPFPMIAMADEPQSVELGGFDFTPTLKIGERYDDNFRTLPNQVESSWITSVRPTFVLETQTRTSGYQLEYDVDSLTYQDHADADHVDQHVMAKSIVEFDSRNRLNWELGYRRAENTVQTAQPRENDKYTLKNADLGYSFGVLSGMNQIDLLAEYQQLRYRNSDGINDDKEHNTTLLVATWFHRLGGSTRALVEVRHSDFDYLLHDSTRNSTGDAALVGVTRDVSAKVSGSVRVGYERKDFEGVANDYSSPTWEVGVDWKPRTYSTFSLNASKKYEEGDDGSYTVHDTSTRLGWRHTWSPWIASEIDYRYADLQYLGIGRDDKLNTYGASLIYSATRWADITLGYQRWENDSNFSDQTYTRNVFMLSIALSL